MTLKWNCKRQGCYATSSLPNWAMLDGCFQPTSVAAADIDGAIHQNGRILFLEKKFPNGWMDEPQIRMINSLVAQGNSWISIWCEDPLGKDITMMRAWGITGYDSRQRTVATLEDFRLAVMAWWKSVYVRGKV